MTIMAAASVIAVPFAPFAAALPAAAAPPFADGEWTTYAARFIRANGRVVDTGNHGVSHSEGQGYGMLLALAAGDRTAFATIWRWTQAHLAIRDDGLFAWRWDPARPDDPVADPNDASDGDILIAWALARAAIAWPGSNYAAPARAIARAVRTKLVTAHGRTTVLLPGTQGFQRPQGPIVNLSYWVFPAFPALAVLDPDPIWSALELGGLELLGKARFGPWGLPPDWLQLAMPPTPAPGFPVVFGYNAVRIPLYLLWAGLNDARLLAPFRALWSTTGDTPPAVVDLAPAAAPQPATNIGVLAIARLTLAQPGTPPLLPMLGREQHYFAASLALLAHLAFAESRPQ